MKKLYTTIPTLLVILFLLSGCNEQPVEGFFGVYTTDSFPVKGFSVVDAGSTLSTSSMFYGPQGKGFDSEDRNYLGSLATNMMTNVRQDLEKSAKEAGYNAIIGYRVTIAQSFDGYDGSLINGNLGMGYATVMAQGVPVKLSK